MESIIMLKHVTHINSIRALIFWGPIEQYEKGSITLKKGGHEKAPSLHRGHLL